MFFGAHRCGLKQSLAVWLQSRPRSVSCHMMTKHHFALSRGHISLKHKESTVRFLLSACLWLRRTACSTSSIIVASVLKGGAWRLRSCANSISYLQLEDPSRVSSWQESEIHSNCWNVHVLSKAILTSWGVNNQQLRSLHKVTENCLSASDFFLGTAEICVGYLLAHSREGSTTPVITNQQKP